MRRKKPKPVEEHEAGGEIERVFHEIRQTVRVSGVALNFRTLATFERAFPLVWDALRPNVESRAFEEAADELRREAVALAESLPRATPLAEVELGESQRYRLAAALDLYHYANPKLLVFTAALRLALKGELGGATGGQRAAEVIARGVPPSMHPMEMAPEEPEDPELHTVFEDIRRSYGLESLNGEYRTLGLWPDYLREAWQRLKPLVRTPEYERASGALRDLARRLASSLPHPVDLRPDRLPVDKEHEALCEVTDRFERILPPLVLNVALMALDRLTPEVARSSPFPARFVAAAPGGSS